MSDDPKTKPMNHGVPEQTPDLLQRPLDLDRRTRRAPEAPIPGATTPSAPPSNVQPRKAPPSPAAFAAERAQAVTEPARPQVARPPAPVAPPRAPTKPLTAAALFSEAPELPNEEPPAHTAPMPLHLAKTEPGRPGPMAPAPAPAKPQPKPAPVQSAAARVDEIVATPAPVWRRVGAWLVDLAVISGVVIGLLVVASMVIGSGTGLAALSRVALPGAVLGLLFAFVYTTLFAFIGEGRTLGRRLLGIWLVDATGQAPGPMRALVRAGLAVVSFALLLSGFWLALFDRKGQTLHDKLSSTFVVQLEG